MRRRKENRPKILILHQVTTGLNKHKELATKSQNQLRKHQKLRHRERGEWEKIR